MASQGGDIGTGCSTGIHASTLRSPLPDEVHIWRYALQGTAPGAGYVAPDEEVRCALLHFAADRRRLQIRLSVRRWILSRYVQCAPNELQFVRNEFGKPRVASPSASFPIEFNASATADMGLLAVANGRDVGVDIERIRCGRFWLDIANSFLCPGDVSSLRALSARAADRAFFSVWTRKEALVKGAGQGLRIDPSAIPARVLVQPRSGTLLDNISFAGRGWSIWDVSPDDEHQAALACEGSHQRLLFFQIGPAAAF